MDEIEQADDGFQRSDELLLIAYASGCSHRRSAERAGMSESTARRRMADPEFKARVVGVRQDILSEATRYLAKSLARAARKFNKLLKSAKSETVQLGAARSIYDYYMKSSEIFELTKKMDELEAKMDELEKKDAY